MRKVYFVRHGEYDGSYTNLPGRLPVPLSKLGVDQAKRLKGYFADKTIQKIYSSPVLRCEQTSSLISDTTIPVEFDVRLADTLTAYQGYWGDNYEGSKNHFFGHINELGGETLVDVQQRMMRFYEDKVLNANDNLIVCSHSDPIMTLKCAVANIDLPQAQVKRVEKMKLKLGSVLILSFDNFGNGTFEEVVSLVDKNNG